MTKLLNLLLFMLCVMYTTNIIAKDKGADLTYDIVCAGSGTQGYYLVQVSAYVEKSSEIGNDVVCKCAVHGVLFKGFVGFQGCTSQRPLAGSPLTENQHDDFFTKFFLTGGGYASYATMISGSLQTQRLGKRYKVTAIISVAKDQLRKDLEKAGMIKGLSDGF
jgi:hypothetical protein